MKLIVISDNHNDWDVVLKTLESEEYDYAIHLGDACVSEQEVLNNFDYYVGGNHDFFSITTNYFELENIRFAICHGHKMDSIGRFAMGYFNDAEPKPENVDVILHGHLHKPVDRIKHGIRILSPGSISESRLGPNTYLILEIKDGKILDVIWVTL